MPIDGVCGGRFSFFLRRERSRRCIDERDHGAAVVRSGDRTKVCSSRGVAFAVAHGRSELSHFARTRGSRKRLQRRAKRRGDSLNKVRIIAAVIIASRTHQLLDRQTKPECGGGVGVQNSPLVVQHVNRFGGLFEQRVETTFGIASLSHGFGKPLRWSADLRAIRRKRKVPFPLRAGVCYS